MSVVLDPKIDVPRHCSDDVFAALVEVAYHNDRELWDDIVRIYEFQPVTQEQITNWRNLCAAALRWKRNHKVKEYEWAKHCLNTLKASFKE